jgi:Tfp pilus assembly PilM family ATPase
MAAKESILGLSLSDGGVQAVEVEYDGPANTLLAIDEWENTLPAHAGQNGHGVDQFVDYLSAFIKVNHSKSRRISVALDTAQLFLSTLPIEEGLARVDINEHINWELNQYFPETPAKEFITDTHVLAQHAEEKWNDVLSVSVKRQDAYTIQDAVAKLGLNLFIVDVDHFSADTALRFNYPDTNRKFLALVGVKENRLDISLIKNGNMESYSYCIVQSNQEIVDQIGMLSRETKGIYSITTYGTHLDKDLLVQIRRGSSLLVEALNPLRHVRVADSLRLADHLSVPSYRFASAVGVALRRE